MSNKLRQILQLGILCFALSCNSNQAGLTSIQVTAVQDSVHKVMELIAVDVSTKGPIAWAKYFEDVPGFFMVSDGKMELPSGDSAQRFIKNTLIKNISGIQLKWSNIRIEPYTYTLAGIGANFHEDITDFSGKTISEDGYFTGIAEQVAQGWQLRNAHWSSLRGK